MRHHRPALREDQAWPTVGGIGTDVLLSQTFDRDAITTLRHSVTSCAGAAGLSGDRLADFVVAVNELLTNAVRHGGGLGRVVMWAAEGAVVCEVSDSGAGLTATRPEPATRPAADQPGGWGLWLAEELTDTFELITGDAGTTVRVSSRSSLSNP
ncbi:ATP-binding protein [Actinoplanes bogorensis]|uniref:ATP-binding protein n=1 Tax=Paractinoplanes bogorensis TaxID=1610840 RepID=A0ABS5Z639_9ACTN|nr:ATP-binding protein [Actinoplanes bogorensis]MBU2670851.1 ATP-binding protein [Actinoplanes bogorensis]